MSHLSRCLSAVLVVTALATSAPGALPTGTRPPRVSAARWLNSTGPLTLDDLRGQWVLLDFWGVWCTPCRAQVPALSELHREFASKGFVIVAIHTPQKADQVEAFLQKHAVPFAVAVDTGTTAEAYGVDSYPTYVLVNREGIVESLPEHPPDRDAVARLLAKPGGAP